ncbi:hypothetical protein HDV02_002279 [Globomyces sp. JEL0801]|nr:hypothetical protein HDV02_002279 [Globomyces sp. JEL0801]
MAIWTYKWRHSSGESKIEYSSLIEKAVPGIKLSSNAVEPGDERLESTDKETNHLGVTPRWKWYLILTLLNMQCIFQYPVTVAMWGWIGRTKERPNILVGICVPLSFLSMCVGSVWPLLLMRNHNMQVPLTK